MTDTLINHGIRINFPVLGDRNFETSGTVQYKANRQPLNWFGTAYNVGDLIPFSQGSPLSSYSKAEISLLKKFWEQGWLTPAS